LDLVGGALHQWGVENTRQNRVDADTFTHKVTCYGQRHAHDPGFRSRISSLAHLPVLSGDRGGVYDRATGVVLQRIKREHARSRLGRTTEAAHEVDLDDLVECFKRVVLDLSGFLG